MDGRTRRGAVALCAAFVLVAVGGVTVQNPPSAPPPGSAGSATSAEDPATGSVIVPGRYLVQARTATSAQLLRAIQDSGATVDETFTDLWSGFSVTATDTQLEKIQQVAGVAAVYPVYRVSLENPVAFSRPDEASPSAESESDDSAAADPGTETPSDEEGEEPPQDPPATPQDRAVDDSFDATYRTPTPLAVLANDSTDPAMVPGSLVFIDPSSATQSKQVVVDGQGTFTIDADDGVSFVSESGFSGDVDPVTYQVTYADDETDTARISVHVERPAGPVAAPVTATTTAGDPVTTSVLPADPGSPLTLTVCLAGPADGCDTSTTTAAGGWQVEGQRITFTPDAGYTGPAPVDYWLTDEFGRSATGTLTVTVYARPTATDREVTTPYLTAVTGLSLVDDPQGEDGAPLDPGSLVLIDPVSGEAVTVLQIAGEGTYEVHDDGSVSFTPDRGFTGPSVVDYAVSTTAGATVSRRLVVTVTPPQAPTAVDDAADGGSGRTTTVDVLGNDTAHDGARLQAGRVCLVDGDECGAELTAEGGSWLVGPEGTVGFAADAGYTGTVSARYRVSDETGQHGEATVSVAVHPVPVAVDDTGHSAANNSDAGNHTDPIEPLANDEAGEGSAPLDPTSLIFTDEAATDEGHTLATDEGTWRIAIAPASDEQPAAATVVFTPADGFTGDAHAAYRVLDGYGISATATITVTVGALPTAEDDSATTPQGIALTGEHAIDPLANDKAGDDGADGVGDLDHSSLVITATSPTTAGTWTIDPDTARVSFAPVRSFSGDATATYRVTDTFGNTATATITVTVSAITPTADDDTGHSAANSDGTDNHTDPIDPLANDRSGDPTAPLDPTTVTFADEAATHDGHTLVTDAGTWQITITAAAGEQPATARVVFTPADGFTGDASTGYQVLDTNGTPALNPGSGVLPVITVTVGAFPRAGDDAGSTKQNVPVTIDPLANDTGGDDGTGNASRDGLVPSSLTITATSPTPAGTWTIDAGEVTFAPEKTFTGTATATYRVTDIHGNTATATITVTVTAIIPTARDDAEHGPARHAVTVNPLANDSPGDPADPATAGLDPTSVVLTDTSDDGTWTVNPTTGAVTFTPTDTFTGSTRASYQVRDTNGTPARHPATITITIGAFPRAGDDAGSTKQNVPVTIDPLANDTGGDDGTGNASRDGLVPSSLTITATSPTPAGTWTIDAGEVTFAPEKTFTGTATATYRVTDIHGNTATATITVTVAAITPTAANDTGHGPARHPVTVNPLANDRPGDATAPLDPTSVVLTDTSDDGTWTVNPTTGAVTFTPTGTFTGRTSTGYQVRDRNGTPATATIAITIGALTSVRSIQRETPQNVTLTIDPRTSTTFGDDGGDPRTTATLRSLRFVDDKGRLTTQLTPDGQGLWEVTGDNRITFNPESAFIETSSVTIRLEDSFGNVATATVTVVVRAIYPAPVADAANTPANRAVTVNVLANDKAGAATAPLKPATLKLVSSDAKAGSWVVNKDATLTFTPAANVTGTTTAYYQVEDSNRTLAKNPVKVTVAVGALPRAAADTRNTAQDGSTLTINPLDNDTAGDNGTGTKDAGRGFRTASLVLVDPAAASDGKSLTAPSYAWKVGADNRVSFTANWRFTGTVSTQYRVTDNYGNTTTAKLTVTVTPTPATDTERRLAAIGALDAGRDGSGIRVGIIDSGINYQHPDLGGTSSSTFPTTRTTKGWDFVDKDANPADCYGHGTHVAGIVAANGNPKQGGAYGVAPGVTLGAYRVFDCQGSATTDHILAAINRAYSDGMNVVSLSLGATTVSWPNETSYPLTQAAASLVKKGVVVIAAAGNDDNGLFTVGSPAVAPGVISVAATTATGTSTESYSAMGPAADLTLSPTIAAPGSSVRSTWLGTGWRVSSGTSMAAPEVAGAVATILQARGWRTPTAGLPARVAALLYASASPLKSARSGLTDKPDAVFRQGAGLLQLQAALATTVTASPSTLSLGEGTSRKATVTLTNTGTTAVTYQASAVTGTSAAASTGKKTDVGNQTPDWAHGAVGFSASPAKFTVLPGKSQTVKLKITAPSKILKGRNGLLYGGWVTFTGSGSRTVSVPFVGVRGDYQKVKMLPSAKRSFSAAGVSYTLSLPALAYRNSDGDIAQTTSGTRTFRTARGDYPVLMYHLDYPATAIRVKAVNTRTKKSYDAVLSGTSTQLGRQGRDESYTLTTFYGVYKTSKGKLARVPAGTYKLQLRVLRPLGSSSKSSHWETWTTRSLKVSWS